MEIQKTNAQESYASSAVNRKLAVLKEFMVVFQLRKQQAKSFMLLRKFGGNIKCTFKRDRSFSVEHPVSEESFWCQPCHSPLRGGRYDVTGAGPV